MRLLFIEDKTGFSETLAKGLQRLTGEAHALQWLSPTTANWEADRFGLRFPAHREWDLLDFALVDLELFDPKNTNQYEKEDLAGGLRVLPFIRSAAPWLPAVAYSHLFDEPDRALHLAGAFGFDAHLPRGWFTKHSTLLTQWEWVLEQARTSRRRALMGWALAEQAPAHIEIDGSVAANLEKSFPAWNQAVSSCFRFVDKVVLEPVTPGFSGATTLRGFVNSTALPSKGQWFIKIGSPFKLSQEASAHEALRRTAFPFGRMAPLLWPGVLVERGAGVLVYQFASGTTAMVEHLSGIKRDRLAQIVGRVLQVVRLLHEGRQKDRIPLSHVLGEWTSARRLTEALKQFEVTEEIGLCRSLLEGHAKSALSKSVELTVAIVHGDLHAGNVMLGEPDMLIDFAWTKKGPIVADYAKLAADLAVKVNAIRRPSFDEQVAEVGFAGLLKGAGEGLTSDDHEVFEHLFRMYLAEALTYDLGAADKEWLAEVVTG